MRYAVDKLKSLYNLPIEKIDRKAFDRTWYGRELVDLIDNQGRGDHKQSLLAGTRTFDRTSGGRVTTRTGSWRQVPDDSGMISDEFYVRRIGFDRFLLLHGEYFNLNVETLGRWHDLRSLVSSTA